MISRRRLLAGAALLAACGKPRGKPFRGYAFIANQQSRSVAVVDLSTFTLARSVSLPSAPTAVIPYQQRGVAYVLTPESGTIHELECERLTVRRKVTPAPTLVSARLSPDPEDQTLWTLSADRRQLYRIRLDSLQVDRTINLSGTPRDFDLARWVHAAAVSYGNDGSVGILDLKQQNAAERRVKFTGELGSVLFQSNGEQLLVPNLTEPSLTIVRTSDGATVTQLPVAIRPENYCMAVDGGEIYFTGPGADAVVVVQPYQTQVAATILAGSHPGSVAASSDYLFVANPEVGNVCVIDIETRRLATMVRVGRGPKRIVITPDGQFALVLNQESGDLSVIHIPALRANKFKRASLLTMIPVGEGPVSAGVLEVRG